MAFGGVCGRVNHFYRIMGNDDGPLHFHTVGNHRIAIVELVGDHYFPTRINPALCNVGKGFALAGRAGNHKKDTGKQERFLHIIYLIKKASCFRQEAFFVFQAANFSFFRFICETIDSIALSNDSSNDFEEAFAKKSCFGT